ncbi:hypothetical protein BOX15_Mlig026683g1, partial [Macrostomum lignano]
IRSSIFILSTMVTDYHKVDHVPKDVNFTDKFASKFLVSSENSELPLLNCKDISEVLDNGPCSSSLKIFKSEPLPAAMPPEKDCSAKSTLPAIMSVDRMCESEPSRGQKPKEWQPLIDGQQVGGLKDADPLVRQPLDKTTVAGGLLSENDNEYYDYGPSMSAVSAPCTESPPSDGAPCTEAPPSDGAPCTEAPPSDGAPCTEAPPSDGAPCTESPPSDGAPCTEAPPSDGAPCTEAPPSDGAPCTEAPPSDGAPCTEAPPSDGAPCTESPLSDGAPCTEAPPSDGAPCTEAPPSDGAPCTEAPPSDGAPCTEAPPSDGAPCTESPLSDGAPCTESPPSDGAPCTEAPLSDGAPCTESPPSDGAPCTEAPPSDGAPCTDASFGTSRPRGRGKGSRPKPAKASANKKAVPVPSEAHREAAELMHDFHSKLFFDSPRRYRYLHQFVIILIMANCNQLEPHNALLASLVKFCDANKKNCQPQIFDSHDGVHFRFLPEGTVDVGILWALFKAQQPSDSPQPSDAAASRRDGKIKKPSDYSFTRVTDAIKSCLKNNTSTTSSDSAFQSVEAANRHKKKLLYRLGPKGLRDLRTAYDHCCPGLAGSENGSSAAQCQPVSPDKRKNRRKRKRAPSPMSCDSVSGDVDMRDVENGDAQTPSAEVPVVPAAPGEQQTTVLSIVTAHLPVATFKRTERAVGEIQRPGDDHFCPGPEQEVPPPPAKKLKSSAGRQRKLPSTRPM